MTTLVTTISGRVSFILLLSATYLKIRIVSLFFPFFSFFFFLVLKKGFYKINKYKK